MLVRTINIPNFLYSAFDYYCTLTLKYIVLCCTSILLFILINHINLNIGCTVYLSKPIYERTRSVNARLVQWCMVSGKRSNIFQVCKIFPVRGFCKLPTVWHRPLMRTALYCYGRFRAFCKHTCELCGCDNDAASSRSRCAQLCGIAVIRKAN